MLVGAKNTKEKKISTIAIDATNIIIGGGSTHLKNLIDYYIYNLSNKFKLIVFCNNKFSYKKKNKNLKIIYIGKFLSKRLFWRLIWIKFFLPKKIKKYYCNKLFSPGGITFKNNFQTISMFRNLQPFQLSYKTLYGLSFASLRVILLRFFLINSFIKSDKIIFLSSHAKKIIQKKLQINNKSKIINHGVKFFDKIFYNSLKKKKLISVVYVSSFDVYKNHINVLKAIKLLRKDFDIKITFIGSYPNEKVLNKIKKHIDKIDPKKKFITLKGNLNHKILMRTYKDFDLGIHASSCENFPNIVIEMLSKNLPIITSGIPVMKEILGKRYIFFNENNHLDIYRKIKKIINSPKYINYLNRRVKVFKMKYDIKKQMKNTFDYLINA